MALTLHYLSGSPFAWKVWLALEHKGTPYELRVVSRDGGDLATDQFRTLNPHRKAPVLEHDGFVLYESSAIIEYLEEVFPERPLWPSDIRGRAIARRVMAECQSSLYPPVRRIVEAVLMDGGARPDEGAVTAALNEASAAAGILEGSLTAPFFNGDTPGASDYSLYPLSAIMARLEKSLASKGPSFDLSESFIDWRARMSTQSIVVATQPPHWN